MKRGDRVVDKETLVAYFVGEKRDDNRVSVHSFVKKETKLLTLPEFDRLYYVELPLKTEEN